MPGLHISEFSLLVERYRFAIHHGFIRQRGECLRDIREAGVEILVIFGTGGALCRSI